MNLQTITQRLKLITFYCIATGISVISLGATYTTNVHALSDMLDASKDSNKTLGINSAANVYNQLESKYISLQKDYEVLEANYNTLENENEKLKEELEVIKGQEELKTIQESTKKPTASDDCLNPYDGTYDGPSGKETYYNLPMNGVVEIMRAKGYSETEYPYWVREDGCKMFGGYIMVAADLNIRPKGTILKTSLGTAMVCDTGTFALSNPTQIDIAVDWE